MPSIQSASLNVLAKQLLRRVDENKLFHDYNRVYEGGKTPPDITTVGVYPWQVEFHNAGATHSERALMAANQVGKTSCAGAEMACHLIGEYPPWWKGKKFTQPVQAWTGSESTEASRDIIQAALLGEVSDHGTGWIPKERIIDVKYRQAGVPDVVESIKVQHISGGTSAVALKTYEQGRRKWMGTRKDVVWLDEEAPMDVYTEALTRTASTNGILYTTFTPLIGVSNVVIHFMDATSESIYFRNVSWDDAPHLDEEKRAELLASYPEWERATRTTGTPIMGTGVVFPIADGEITVDPFEVPSFFARINGVDFGIDHPAAGVHCAHDRDNDIFYVVGGYKTAGQTPVYHADALKNYGSWVPTAWPHDGMIRDKGSGRKLKDMYRRHGVRMLAKPAHYDGPQHEQPDKKSVEPAVIEMLEYMREGKFKVFSTFSDFFAEKRVYHRKDGLIIPKNDDILAATRIAFISRRYAATRVAPVRKTGPTRPIIGGVAWRH